MTLRIGLTGSIGMGKSTTAAMFAELGATVWNADDAVHRLYAPGGKAVESIRALCPDAIDQGGVSRPRLAEAIANDPTLLARIEAAVHPLVAEDRDNFLQSAPEIAILDIPLLFEGNLDHFFDFTVTVCVDPATQRARVMAREGMTEEKFAMILARQMPDEEKRARADYVIVTDTLDSARLQVENALRDMKTRQAGNARDRTRHRDDRT